MKQEKLARDKPDFSALTGRVFQADAVKAVRAAGAPVVTLSNNASDGFIQPLGDHARGVIVTQVFPNERSVAFPLIKEAQDLAKAKGLDGVLPAMMEGFDAAKVLLEGLRRAGPNSTPAALRDALESMRNFNIGSLSISDSPPTTPVWISPTGLSLAPRGGFGAEGIAPRPPPGRTAAPPPPPEGAGPALGRPGCWPLCCAGSAAQDLTISTGTLACVSTFCATLPKMSALMP